jgi:hypothetical protein
VVAGFKVTIEEVAELLQLYVLAPVTVNVAGVPAQILAVPAIFRTGNGFTTIVTLALFVLVQPVSVFVPASE